MNPGTVEGALQVLPDHAVELALEPGSQPADRHRRSASGAPTRATWSWSADRRRQPMAGRSSSRGAYCIHHADGARRLRLPGAPGGRRDATPTPDSDARLRGPRPLLDADAPTPVEPGGCTPPAPRPPRRSARRAPSPSASPPPMDTADVEERFAITPAVPGELSWEGDDSSSRHRATGTGHALHDQRHRLPRPTRQSARRKGQLLVHRPAGAQVTQTAPEAEAADIEPRHRRALVQPADGRRGHERGLRPDEHGHRRARRRQPRPGTRPAPS